MPLYTNIGPVQKKVININGELQTVCKGESVYTYEFLTGPGWFEEEPLLLGS